MKCMVMLVEGLQKEDLGHGPREIPVKLTTSTGHAV